MIGRQGENPAQVSENCAHLFLASLVLSDMRKTVLKITWTPEAEAELSREVLTQAGIDRLSRMAKTVVEFYAVQMDMRQAPPEKVREWLAKSKEHIDSVVARFGIDAELEAISRAGGDTDFNFKFIKR